MSSAFQRYMQGNPVADEMLGHPVPKSTTTPLEAMSLQDRARRLTFEYVSSRLEKTDTHVTFKEDDVYVVWMCKTLQNWKALVSTMLPDGMYYELTYNGDKGETYIDAYKKFDNVCVPDEE